jgi:2,4-dienoyl-CoA reductase (NADPH2)
MQVPGKEDFKKTLKYFLQEVERLGIKLELNCEYKAEMDKEFDDVVFASGVKPRVANFPCDDGKRVYHYDEVIRGEVEIGDKVAILGAGGIGFDMIAFLQEKPEQSIDEFKAQWGIETPQAHSGPKRQLYMLKRSAGRFGAELGKTTGWIHREVAKQHNVKQLAECEYLAFDAQGLKIRHKGEEQYLDVDTVIACIGQVSNDKIFNKESLPANHHVIGGAKLAAAIDAKRAIFEALQVARKI